MTLALLAALFLQEKPEETYRALEKKFVNAPGVVLQFKGEATIKKGERVVQSTFTGTIKVKPGNKGIFDFTFMQGEKSNRQVSKSDGKTTVNERDGVKAKASPVQDGTTEFLRECTVRAGFTPLTVATSLVGGDAGANDLPKPDDTVALSDFTSPEKNVLEYKVKLYGKMEGTVKLWLSDGLPAKRVFTAKHEGVEITITETYEKVSLEEIPDKDFSHE